MPKFKKTQRKCRECGEKYIAVRRGQRYCSAKCRAAKFNRICPRLTAEEAQLVRAIAKRMGMVDAAK